MADKLEFDLIIKAAESAKTVGEIKQSLKDINTALQNVDVNSKDFEKLTVAAGKAKAEMMDLKGQIKGLDPDNRVAGFGKVLGGVANGFSAATSAAALFGSESEDLQKTLIKVQAAMAFANAIQGVMELGDAFKVLNAIVRANPIGALITALTALAAIAGTVYQKFFSMEAQLQANVELAEQDYEVTKKKGEIINATTETMKRQGMTEKEILQTKMLQTEEEIIKLQANIVAQKNLAIEQEKTAERGQKILTNILNFLTVPIKFITQQIDWIMNALGEESNLTKNLDKNIAEIFFDPDTTKKKGQETLDAMDLELKKLINQRDGFHNQINTMNSNQHKKELDDLKKHQQDIIDAQIADILWREEQEKKRKEEEEKKKKESDALFDQMNAEDDAFFAEKDKKDLKNQQDKLKSEEDIMKARKAIQESLFSSLTSLGQIFINNQKKAEKFQKVLAITELAINTAKAISNAIASAKGATGIDYVAQIAIGVSAVLANIAKAKAILSKVGDSGAAPQLDTGGFSASGGIPNLNPQPNASTLLNPDGTVVNPNKEQPPVKAYVVETEMTSTQNKISSIENRSRY